MLKLGAKQKQPFTVNFLIFQVIKFTLSVGLVTFEVLKMLLKCIRQLYF